MKVLVVEDDYLQAESLLQQLRQHFLGLEATVIGSEAEFLQNLPKLLDDPPHIVILDVMLRWAKPSTDMPPRPSLVREEGHYRAGIRCAELLNSNPKTASVPVILYTFLGRGDLKLEGLPQSVVHMEKDSDAARLILLIRSLIHEQSDLSEGLYTVFIVHGHDTEAKESVARFVEKLGLLATILHEKPNSGRTIIEKVEKYSGTSFAVVLLTPDDVGGRNIPQIELQPRARQNVIFELGFFTARLGRERVAALYKENVELPSDYQGVLYVQMDRAGAWKAQLARELKSCGLPIDMNPSPLGATRVEKRTAQNPEA